ncbi:MAG TPA: CmcJ/NvfI family oxidoreductase [Ideonella sp.]|nr:CmcJ/NvfI family oxidoreductase [Ideonella sp.]
MNQTLARPPAPPLHAWRRPLPAVSARLGYIASPVERPVNYMYDPPEGVSQESCEYDFRDVRIEDARGLAGPTSVHSEGFELWSAASAIERFHDPEAITRTYYPECIELACAATGGASAIVFDHLLRKREAGRPPLTFGRRGDGTQPGSVGRVHNDYTDESGRRRLGLVLRDPELAARVRRYCVVNIWRSVKGPIVDTPLAVCDARTVSVRDMVASEIRYTDRTGEIYLFEHSGQHRWYYYPGMDRDEALVFKQYDSQVSGVARFTPHAAFDLPGIPDDAPLRESIEVRCLVLFD